MNFQKISFSIIKIEVEAKFGFWTLLRWTYRISHASISKYLKVSITRILRKIELP